MGRSCGPITSTKIEVELAFVLSDDLSSADVAAQGVYDAADHVVTALELIDAHSHQVHPDDDVSRTVVTLSLTMRLTQA